MSFREERLTRNEETARRINEQLQQAHDTGSPEGHMRIVCECGIESCERVVAITAEEYRRVRGDDRQFAIVREHLLEEIERPVYETDRFVVVAKREGAPADIVEGDPGA